MFSTPTAGSRATDEGEVVPRNLEENMEGFDLTIVYCLGCSWSGSPKKLVKR